MPVMPEVPVFTPWTFNVFVHDKDWNEIETLRRVNVPITVVTAMLQSWKAVLAEGNPNPVGWHKVVMGAAVVSVEVNRG